MGKFTQVMVLSFGTLAGGAAGFYLLENYKVKAKEARLKELMEQKRIAELRKGSMETKAA
ncbi:hypothetical protein BZG36_01155 [Bifiguratus adelaidae]|uniref:Uncharacterized protein n=1 Tax=Bifiguratus adelaidae TaxID=1938954 RepID=A0A261Y5U9_9FUNG|nr:hypothetical protein BZG36_01155 [Bifiguratus adelaidae]